MMKFMRIIASLFFSLLLIIFCVAHAQAQRCGGGFAKIIVLDAEGNVIPKVTIELIADAPDGEYRDLWDIWSDTDTKQLPAQTAEEVIKQRGQMDRSEDFCRNPLKQTANLTKVNNPHNNRTADGEDSSQKLGFCMVEGRTGRIYILKISAPNYVANYYAGDFLGGCNRSHKFVLSKK